MELLKRAMAPAINEVRMKLILVTSALLMLTTAVHARKLLSKADQAKYECTVGSPAKTYDCTDAKVNCYDDGSCNAAGVVGTRNPKRGGPPKIKEQSSL